MAALQALQQWCKQQCEGYKDVRITNMTTSFRDGLAFCAILHHHRPDLINFSSLSKENVYENNHLAFRVAEEELGIPALLDAEDMVALKVPDRLSILTYVSQYYNYFHGRSPIGGMGGIKRPPSGSGDEPKGKKTVSEPVTPAPAKPSAVHLPPQPKTSPALQGRSRAKENPPVSSRRVLAESSNMRSSLCAVCGGHVHLVQRLLMDGKLYHRNCFRCKLCSSTLQPGNYRPGTEPGSFVCSRHEQPSCLPNSSLSTAKLVAGLKEPAKATSASGNNVQALELKKAAQEPEKPNQPLRSGSTVVASAWTPSLPGANKFNSVAPSPNSRWSGPAGNKPDHPGSPPPACWTASSAKTQQAREKFFQSGLGTSGVPTGKAEAAPSQVSAFSPPQAAGKALSSGANGSGTDSGSKERDKARSFLMNALPGPQPSTIRPGDVSGTSPRSPGLNNSKISPTSPGLQHLETKDTLRSTSVTSSAEKTGKMPSKTTLLTHHPSSELGKKVNVGAATQNIIKDQPLISKSAGSERKPDIKVTKVGSGSAVEEKLENPADWRSRLKPVANKINHQDDARTSQKPVHVHKVLINITPSPAQKDESSASPVSTPVIQDTADHPQKKKRLVPNLDLSSGWQKNRQQWDDGPANQQVEDRGLPRRTVAPVKPSAPRTFQKLPSDQVVSPSKLSPDYVPEEQIQMEVRQIERDLDELELKGVDMEKQLRGCEGDETEDALLVDWFKLIHEKQLLLRRESELMHKLNQQKLEAKQCDIESELRNLMGKSDCMKSPREKAREDELLNLYITTVNDRNKIIEDLDDDRIRELEEDEMLAAMLQKLDMPRNNQESEKKKAKFGLFRILKTKH